MPLGCPAPMPPAFANAHFFGRVAPLRRPREEDSEPGPVHTFPSGERVEPAACAYVRPLGQTDMAPLAEREQNLPVLPNECRAVHRGAGRVGRFLFGELAKHLREHVIASAGRMAEAMSRIDHQANMGEVTQSPAVLLSGMPEKLRWRWRRRR